MSDHAILLDPFLQITDLCFPGWTWRLRIQRDDGLLYTPASTEGMWVERK